MTKNPGFPDEKYFSKRAFRLKPFSLLLKATRSWTTGSSATQPGSWSRVGSRCLDIRPSLARQPTTAAAATAASAATWRSNSATRRRGSETSRPTFPTSRRHRRRRPSRRRSSKRRTTRTAARRPTPEARWWRQCDWKIKKVFALPSSLKKKII